MSTFYYRPNMKFWFLKKRQFLCMRRQDDVRVDVTPSACVNWSLTRPLRMDVVNGWPHQLDGELDVHNDNCPAFPFQHKQEAKKTKADFKKCTCFYVLCVFRSPLI